MRLSSCEVASDAGPLGGRHPPATAASVWLRVVIFGPHSYLPPLQSTRSHLQWKHRGNSLSPQRPSLSHRARDRSLVTALACSSRRSFNRQPPRWQALLYSHTGTQRRCRLAGSCSAAGLLCHCAVLPLIRFCCCLLAAGCVFVAAVAVSLCVQTCVRSES